MFCRTVRRTSTIPKNGALARTFSDKTKIKRKRCTAKTQHGCTERY